MYLSFCIVDIKLEKAQGFESDPESYMKSKGTASDDQLKKGIIRERGSESSPETGSLMLNDDDDEPSGLQVNKLTIDESPPSKSKTLSKIFSKGGKKKKIAVSKSTAVDDSKGRGMMVVNRKKSLSPEEDVPPSTTRSPVKKASSKSQPLFSSLSSHKGRIKSPDSSEQQMFTGKKTTKQQDISGTTERAPLKKATKTKKK